MPLGRSAPGRVREAPCSSCRPARPQWSVATNADAWTWQSRKALLHVRRVRMSMSVKIGLADQTHVGATEHARRDVRKPETQNRANDRRLASPRSSAADSVGRTHVGAAVIKQRVFALPHSRLCCLFCRGSSCDRRGLCEQRTCRPQLSSESLNNTRKNAPKSEEFDSCRIDASAGACNGVKLAWEA